MIFSISYLNFYFHWLRATNICDMWSGKSKVCWTMNKLALFPYIMGAQLFKCYIERNSWKGIDLRAVFCFFVLFLHFSLNFLSLNGFDVNIVRFILWLQFRTWYSDKKPRSRYQKPIPSVIPLTRLVGRSIVANVFICATNVRMNSENSKHNPAANYFVTNWRMYGIVFSIGGDREC